MKDALGQPILEGDLVAYTRRIGSSIWIKKRRVHSIVPGKGVRMYATEGYGASEKELDKPSGSYADGNNMVVVTRQLEDDSPITRFETLGTAGDMA
jgi:hypothetical protein